jgi:hypothetical protein
MRTRFNRIWFARNMIGLFLAGFGLGLWLAPTPSESGSEVATCDAYVCKQSRECPNFCSRCNPSTNRCSS